MDVSNDLAKNNIFFVFFFFEDLAMASSLRLCVNMFSFTLSLECWFPCICSEGALLNCLLGTLTVLFFRHFEVLLPTWDAGLPSVPATLSHPLPQSSLGSPVSRGDWAFSRSRPGLFLPLCFADLHLSLIYVFRSALQFTYSPWALFSMLFISRRFSSQCLCISCPDVLFDFLRSVCSSHFISYFSFYGF